MTEALGLINGSDTICHYTWFSGFLEPNCNGCHVGDSKMVELLHLFAENGLVRRADQTGREAWPRKKLSRRLDESANRLWRALPCRVPGGWKATLAARPRKKGIADEHSYGHHSRRD